MNTPSFRLSKRVLTGVVWRSFFLQACWNFQRMQNIGFCFAISPVIKALYPAPAARQKAIKRHLEFFNTHPYCASIILGVVAKLEEQAAQAGDDEAREAVRVKIGMMGPLAAMGDVIYWVMLRPALALVGVSLVLFGSLEQSWLVILGSLCFIGLYSIAHLGLRIGGVFLGYNWGVEIVKELRRLNPQNISRCLSLFMAVMLGMAMSAYPLLYGWRIFNSRILGVGLMALLVGIMYFGLRRGISAAWLFYGMVLLAILAAYAGVV